MTEGFTLIHPETHNQNDPLAVRELVTVIASPDSIQNEQAKLRSLLQDMESVNSTNPDGYSQKSPEYDAIETKLEGTRDGDYPRIMLDTDDERTKAIQDQIHTTKPLARGSWLARRPQSEPGTVTIKAFKDQEPFIVPMSNVVNANNFIDWDTAPPITVRQDDGTERSSADTVTLYASKTTPAPVIEAMTGFIQPDGTIFFFADLGAHRTVAAMKRGDPTISVGSLTLVRIPTNLFE
jgi:hypothetical protein